MSNFKVGTLCEFRSLNDWRSPYNGTECTITGGLAERYGATSKRTALCYEVHSAFDNQRWLVEQHNLRQKYLPSKDDFTAGDWDLMPWSPYKTKETAHG